MSYLRDTILATRVITALVLGGVVTAAILLMPTAAAAAILAVLWLAGAWEWAGFARWGKRGRGTYVAMHAGLMLTAAYWLFDARTISAVLAVAALWWGIALVAVLIYPRSIAAPAIAAAGVLVLLPAWLVLTYLHAVAPQGPALVLSLLAVIWAADVGAFACGHRFGRVKLAPRVSPGKTWEGVIGGLLLAGLTAGLASWALGLPGVAFVGMGLAAALASVLGDLTVSLFKRNVGLKDSGRMLPGHGGVMDRIDSLTAAVPVFALGLKVAELIP